MINEYSVSKALLDHLKTLSGLPALAQENKPFTPVVDSPYIREVDYSGVTQTPTLASDGFQRKDGIYRVDILTPKDKGKFNGLAYFDLIAAGFGRGDIEPLDNDKLEITSVTRGQPFSEGEFYVIVASIRYTVIN